MRRTGRPERVVDSTRSFAHFANDLVELRKTAGLTVRDLAAKANYSLAVISAAVDGLSLPSKPVTEAYVRACGGADTLVEEWCRRHDQESQRARQVKKRRAAEGPQPDSPPAPGALASRPRGEPTPPGGALVQQQATGSSAVPVSSTVPISSAPPIASYGLSDPSPSLTALPPEASADPGQHPEATDPDSSSAVMTSPEMDRSFERNNLLEELQQLRRGHGLHAPDVLSRVGPNLVRILGLDQTSSTGARRGQLNERIEAMVSALPQDLRLAVQAALALPPADQSRFLRERMEWLGDQMNRDPKTAMRRVQSGLALLAERMLLSSELDTADHYAPDGWFVDSFRTTLILNRDPVELLETRRVISTVDGLDRITMAWSIPADAGVQNKLRVDLLYGGELQRDEQISTETFFSSTLILPRPLRAGETHEFQVRVTGPPRDKWSSYFVLTPFRRCDEFVLRVKFGIDDNPVQVWNLDGVPFQLVHENQPVGEVIVPDSAREILRLYRNLRPGLSYGLRWQDALVPHNNEGFQTHA
jgi:hypothetical protein